MNLGSLVGLTTSSYRIVPYLSFHQPIVQLVAKGDGRSLLEMDPREEICFLQNILILSAVLLFVYEAFAKASCLGKATLPFNS